MSSCYCRLCCLPIQRNLDTTVQQTTKTNANGFFSFTTLPVGRYEIEILREGFKPYKRTGLIIDVNAALREDITLTMGEQSEEVVVSDTAVHVETESSQMGEVVTGTQITAVALNGRSFTDLLALQPGIVPMSTQQPDSIIMAGVTVAIAPSGVLNPGNQSISGQREDANGFMVNGGDVKELMNGGTTIVPNLDSIGEFRILTNNFDAEYGNYSGGVVNVVTKSGTNRFHGSGFEFAIKVRSEPIRRHDRRTDREEQCVFLRRLSRNSDGSGHRYRADTGPFAG